jgi:Domain of unknown function (DUF3854)
MAKNCIRDCGSVLESQEFLQTNLQPTRQAAKRDLKREPRQDAEAEPNWAIPSRLGCKIAIDHEQEWLASGVDPQLIRLNVQTLTDTVIHVQGQEVSYPIAERLNWKMTRSKAASTAGKPELRGWWVSGVDPLNHWQPMLWGRFKPDATSPVFDRHKGKPAKYLSPSLGKGSSRCIFLDVPFRIWQRVADRYQVPIVRSDYKLGFWQWVWQHRIPLVLTEGEKKAGCLLTAGYVAIALPGIFGGYRRDGHCLIPELAHFAQAQHPFYICFDYETRSQVVDQIAIAITKLGTLLMQSTGEVRVIGLPGPQKGVDDFTVECGVEAFSRLYDQAASLQDWQTARLWALTAVPDQVVNQAYLENIAYPESGLIGIKSPKGTGKTTALQSIVQQAKGSDRTVLVITHRIQLGRSICEKLDLPWISDFQHGQTFHGYGLCIDSLHPHSQAQFDPQAWAGAIVILDEVEQIIWHALNSMTCYVHRVKILATLKELVQTVLSTGGRIIAQDADLSDVSLDYLLSGVHHNPWLLINEWQSEQGNDTYIYDTKNPAALLARLEEVAESGPVFVCLDSQKVKGRWSSRNLETYLKRRFPQKRILRIDSETVTSVDHPAFEIGDRLNEKIASYDIVLSTPTLGSGVSIDLKHHFQAVFGIFQGVMSATESRQSLARVRDAVPRYIWAARNGLGKIGNGSCFYRDLVQSTTKAVKYNILLLREVDFDVDRQTDPITLRTWAKMAARVNRSLWNFRNEMATGLQQEGQTLTWITDDTEKILQQILNNRNENRIDNTNDPNCSLRLQSQLVAGDLHIPGYEFLYLHHAATAIEQIQRDVTLIRDYNQSLEAQAVSDSPELTLAEYQEMRETRSQTTQQRYSKRKQELKNRYPVTITPELSLKDDQGWYAQLRLHYYLIHDPIFVRLRDCQEWQSHLDRGNGQVAIQDVKLLTAQVEMLKALGVLSLLNCDRKTRATDPDVQEISATLLAHRQDIKILFGLNITDRMSPITAIQAVLAKLDLRLVCISRDRTADGRRGGLRVYRYDRPNDDRERIFAEWRQQDALMA